MVLIDTDVLAARGTFRRLPISSVGKGGEDEDLHPIHRHHITDGYSKGTNWISAGMFTSTERDPPPS